MKLSVIQTVNNRTREVMEQVRDSFELPGNQPDQMVIVLDRPTPQVYEETKAVYRKASYPVTFTTLSAGGYNDPNSAGCGQNAKHQKPDFSWKGPATAWNAGFASANGDIFYCISSEVVQDAGNVDKVREYNLDDIALFGACHNSVDKQLVTGAEPGLLVSSKMTRPLGFIVAMPAVKVREIGGFDEEFMKGFWYDDDDFFYRLWGSGVDFVFDDHIHGIHLDHDRKALTMDKVKVNRRLMTEKHGEYDVWRGLARIEEKTPGWTRWKHI